MLSPTTIEHLNDAESHLRAALKSASVNENSNVILMISKILAEVDNVKKFENLMDMLQRQTPEGNGGNFKFY